MQTKQQKKELVKDLAGKLKASKAVVFSDFKGLSVKAMTSLRQELREKGIDFKVLKKTLINVALRESKIDFDAKKMEGQIAVATSDKDEVEAAKIIAKAAKTNQNIKITGGLLGDKALTGEEVLELSKLPGKEELLAKLVGTLNAPISGFARVLSGNLRGLVQVLGAISESKSKG
ncbi:MAG: 50S ribosomal protein L10 [Candidatus Moranbacteria bacterium RIFOXYA12_FULL_44_15]|nr:MAG: 50S ribosomal protein L10 [Candidatus Moranbacteria bacterium RIFOXYA12_FULL_44_15]OGI35585.1 MAG: 50S ribosomal protein L10 [Candidatus Moranbacteria bacterium RIFOXYA2_FULL_43_15]